MNTQPNVVDALRVREIPAVLTIPEAAEVLRLKSPTSVYALIADGKLKSFVVNGRRTISGSSVVELLRSSEQAAYSPTRESPKKRKPPA